MHLIQEAGINGELAVIIRIKIITEIPNGTVFVSPPAIITTSCTVDISYFPYDSKTCLMSWGRYN